MNELYHPWKRSLLIRKKEMADEKEVKFKVSDCKHERFGVVYNGVMKQHFLYCLKCGKQRPSPATAKEIKRWKE